MNDIGFSFMPVANTDASHERTRIEPGEYRATCIAVKPPELYRAFTRWYMRVDFSIHETGEVVSKYINLGVGKEPNAQLGPRTDYYKLWSQAVGRKPAKNEVMDPARIIGVELLVMVADKHHGGDGEPYSMVQSVRRELEALSSSLNSSLLNSSSLSPQLLNVSDTQCLNDSGAQVPSAAQVDSGSQEEEFSGFPVEEIPPRGPQRFRLLEELRESDPENAKRFLLACRLKDAA